MLNLWAVTLSHGLVVSQPGVCRHVGLGVELGEGGGEETARRGDTGPDQAGALHSRHHLSDQHNVAAHRLGLPPAAGRVRDVTFLLGQVNIVSRHHRPLVVLHTNITFISLAPLLLLTRYLADRFVCLRSGALLLWNGSLSGSMWIPASSDMM